VELEVVERVQAEDGLLDAVGVLRVLQGLAETAGEFV